MPKKKKIFVPDTNVLLHNFRALELFGNNELMIPLTVLEELDKFKKGKDETNVNARSAIRLIDKLREQGNLAKGVKLDSGGFLRVISNNNKEIKKIMKRLDLDESIPDNKIIGVAVYLQEKYKDKKVILVSQDINMRVKASVLGIFVENFDREVDVDTEDDEFYKGYIKIEVPKKEINQLYRTKKLILRQKNLILYPHQFVILQAVENKSQSAIAKVVDANKGIITLLKSIGSVFNIIPKNLEQRMALSLLLDSEVKVITFSGRAGTGKTLLALAASLHLVLNVGSYGKVIVTRPTVAFGEDKIGFLPGEKEKKLEPWMGPIFDNLRYLFKGRSINNSFGRKMRFYPDAKTILSEGILELESLAYMRGRSIFDAVVIVDEAQNLTPKKIKTIITRCGENSKFIFTGDPWQIDDPYLDRYNNGLTVLIEKSKKVPFAGHMFFTKTERSEVAEMYAEIL